MGLILTNDSRKKLLTCAVTATAEQDDGWAVGAKLMPYQTGPALNENMVAGDFTFCDYTGAALSSAVTWGTAGYTEGGYPQLSGDAHTFTMTDAVTPNTVIGYVLCTGSLPSVVVLAAETLSDPVHLVDAGQSFTLVPTLNLNAQNLGTALLAS